jgi:hypothetical protein
MRRIVMDAGISARAARHHGCSDIYLNVLRAKDCADMTLKRHILST